MVGWLVGEIDRNPKNAITLLRKMLGKASLPYEDLNIILCDAEAIINTRPLTYIYFGRSRRSQTIVTVNVFARESGIRCPRLRHVIPRETGKEVQT